MKRPASSSSATVALFPFLAVLICTMGALIVLLVLLVQQARMDANTQLAGAALPSPVAEREALEDAQWRKNVLEQSRAEKTEELAATRTKLAHLEEHAQRLKAEAEALLAQARAIDEGRKLRDDELAAARAALAQWQEKIAQQQRALEEKRRQVAEKDRSYALIPYEGPLGTRRRPIYIECTELGVILQPEGILLRAEDFQGPLGPGNPLEVALRAIREHLERTAGSEAGQPYPLLVVRPGGVLAYAAARAAMKSWDDEFGYELVGDELQLDFGPPNPALSRLVQQTVAEARRRQAALAAMMPRRYGRDEPPPPAPVSASSAAATPAGPGGLGLGPAPGGLPTQASTAAPGAGRPPLKQPDGPGPTSAAEHPTSGMAGRSGTASPSTSPTGKAALAAHAQAGKATAGQRAGGSAGRSDDQGTGPEQSSGAAHPSSPSGGSGATRGGGPAASAFVPSSPASAAADNPSAAGTPGGAAPWGATSPSGPNLNLQFGQQRPAATSPDKSAPGSSVAKRGASSHRPNWALPTAKPHAIGVTRPIPLTIQADRVTLLPSRGQQRAAHEIAVHPELTEDDVQRLVAAVQREVEGWGLAVADGYWKPLLVADVAPDGEGQFARLQTALQGSGLELVRKTR
jgi:hypothetical protein